MREVRPALVNTSPYPSDAWCIFRAQHYSRFSGAPKSFCMDMHGNSAVDMSDISRGKEQTVVSLMSDRYHGVQIRNLLLGVLPFSRRFLSDTFWNRWLGDFNLSSYWAVTGQLLVPILIRTGLWLVSASNSPFFATRKVTAFSLCFT